ncbi:hypothetical protein [Pseudorhodoferax sp. Leaf267]|uniref:hypothetical protein n=1 Tax=Pseudorhodoferax sp. Leaf267 TaxID=1736316 RepID=UPI000712A63C|nr:hypothetical protein [Pseudorhodoferax sp. Leaf267]KQP22964.1 hypothetical protein ASF43_03480 [Pseudorhodoferax sp. Leaf267]
MHEPLPSTPSMPRPWARRGVLGALLAGLAGVAMAQDAPVRERLMREYQALRAQLASSPLGQPLLISSSEADAELRGQVHAVVDTAFADLCAALSRPQAWCEILVLHLNTKRCVAGDGSSGSTNLAMAVTRKHDHAAKDAFLLDFRWDRVQAGPDALQIVMTAPEGPLGTANYRIVLDAIALPGGKSFLSFAYACRFSTAARLGMRTYLSTFGRDKVGFTKVEGQGEDVYVGGMRGVIERTAMRYYLAIEAWFAASRAPATRQRELRMQRWFEATERYPRQLHETDLAEYLAGKRQAVP